MPKITFYTAPMSSATPVAHALAELEVAHERVEFDLSRGDQKSPRYLAINPNATVPCLVVDGTPFFEALAIMQWLGDSFGVDRGLWPAADSPERLQALSWSTWAYVTFAASWARFDLLSKLSAEDESSHSALAEARKQLEARLSVLEARLESHSYLLGDSFGLVDLIVGSVVAYAALCGVDFDAHPKVAAWVDRIRARPSFVAAWQRAAPTGVRA